MPRLPTVSADRILAHEIVGDRLLLRTVANPARGYAKMQSRRPGGFHRRRWSRLRHLSVDARATAAPDPAGAEKADEDPAVAK